MESWLKQSGASGLDDLELADFSDTGRGVRTLRRFKDGEEILTIPHGVLWTVEHAYADPFLGPALLSTRPPLSVDDTLAMYILFVQSRGSGYDGLGSHVAALPASYTSSIFFAEAELEVCAGTSLHTVTKQLHRQIKDDYRGLVVRLLEQHQELFPRDKFTIEDYKWALCTVWSRAMDFKLPNGDSIRLLAPFADMLNHSSEVRQSHVYDVLSGDVSVLAGKDYELGDQVFINYGPIPNNRLLRLYGFVVPGNPNDSYDLVLTTHPMAPFFEQKHKLWVSAGLDSTSTISLTLTDPLPSSVLRYLRIQRLHQSDLALIAHHQSDVPVEKISDSNEMEVLRFLIESISGILDGFGTQLEKLEEQLSEGFYSPDRNAWLAAHVSLGEQRVLRLTRETAEGLLAEVESGSGNKRGLWSAPAQCAKCKKVSVQLMRCGRCNAVMYCGRACQVAHYREHKAMCRATASKNGSQRD
ncbi:SET domain-containing protein [Amniculicola lignicola CBS 123094]|uniref:SET domain-containing protein n=1 Tax=Amniculicola lignicola CBS 123094 TaxID=1392246 RepID=A0A6A5WVB1_9PLEO|nr:SET domain-containing protein [Amniculicola lignicola CBS 123094]